MIFDNIRNKNIYNLNTSLVCNERKYSYDELINEILFLQTIFKDKNKSGLIYLPKNEHLIFFMLALNASNNIFTSLDINTPKERVFEIISQLKSKWIISLEDFSSLGFKMIKDNENYKIWQNEYNLSYDDNISHIYFSSGSNGKPKGILLSPKPLINVVTQQSKITNLTLNKKFAWILSPSFDASLSDIYSSFLAGAELHICDFAQNKIKTLISYFKINKITHTDISPSVLFLLQDKLLDPKLSLESIIFGGEVAHEDTIKTLSKNINMFNAYGPTETTICSSLKKVDDTWTANNIGNPLLHNKFYISSKNELYISGPNLCIGYLNEKLNIEKFFIKNGIRFYKTGDLVEYKNNEYYFLGRIDRQFKHNGVLISPEEIEYNAKLAGCIEAQCKKTDTFILLYQGQLTEKDLRSFLEKKLTQQMIPNLLIKVDSFETNLNGKIKI